MNNLVISTFLVGLLSFSNSCVKIGLDDKLTLTKQDYIGNQLNIKGYYYQESGDKFYTIYFFYEDGTLLYGGGGINQQELDEY
jgi:hypothetical protein